jgi:hypothetical protein
MRSRKHPYKEAPPAAFAGVSEGMNSLADRVKLLAFWGKIPFPMAAVQPPFSLAAIIHANGGRSIQRIGSQRAEGW